MVQRRRKAAQSADEPIFTAPVPGSVAANSALTSSKQHAAPAGGMLKHRRVGNRSPSPQRETVRPINSPALDKPPYKAPIQTFDPTIRLLGLIPLPRIFLKLAAVLVLICAGVLASSLAYNLRTFAIKEYGPIIHEFDPWFNFRATKYLAEHGPSAFFQWYDHESWYPIGRPVGTTIYPGMQFMGVALWRFLEMVAGPFHALTAVVRPFLAQASPYVAKQVGVVSKMLPMSLNDVCVYMPAWFGAVTSILIGLLAGECAQSTVAAAVTAVVMAVMPAHLMRSIGGGFDNECVAIACMALVFWLWVRSIRIPPTSGSGGCGASIWDAKSCPWVGGALAGVAYFVMAATWGGYVFVGNLVGMHAAAVTAIDWLVLGTWTDGLWKAYTAFYIVGVGLATRVPVIGYTPLRSLEQIPMLLVLGGLWILAYCEHCRAKRVPPPPIRSLSNTLLRLKVIGAVCVAMSVPVYVAFTQGYFGPLSARVRGLFVPHTRTGNPLVDSVAEHHPARAEDVNYFFDRWWEGTSYGVAALVVAVVLLRTAQWRQASFLIVYFYFVQFFMLKMSRLLLLAGPVVSALCGVALGVGVDTVLRQFAWRAPPSPTPTPRGPLDAVCIKASTLWNFLPVRILRAAAAVAAVYVVVPHLVVTWPGLYRHAVDVAEGSSHPQIMFKAKTRDGKQVLVDDYYKGYLWLKKHTPKDARVMAWWDYGYQITGIGERTSIADGNTWNHEHIATLGKILTSSVKKSHSYIRHLADYVLVWSGGNGDDLAKSTHLVRIGHSVFRDTCGDDPLCQQFGFSDNGPTPMMRKSLLFNLCLHGKYGIQVPEKYYSLVWSGANDMMRIFKVNNVSLESKEWVADPANRVCDSPSSWMCKGQFPPAEPIQKLLQKRLSFSQIEDFNRGGKDSEYHEKYMSRFGGGSE